MTELWWIYIWALLPYPLQPLAERPVTAGQRLDGQRELLDPMLDPHRHTPSPTR